MSNANSYMVTEYFPTGSGLTPNRWCKHIPAADYLATYSDPCLAGELMAEDLFNIRYTGVGINLHKTDPDPQIPAKLIVDEIKAPGSAANYVDYATMIGCCAYWIQQLNPAYMYDQWAVAVSHADDATPGYSQSDVASAMALVLLGGGRLVFEMYPTVTVYCKPGQGDEFLAIYYSAGFMDGNIPGFSWAWDTFSAYQSMMHVLFGVHDGMVCDISKGACDNTDQVGRTTRYMDRMFYAWKAYLPRTTIDAAHGGPGTYQWDDKIATTSRDATWSSFWTQYVINGDLGPHYAELPC